MVYDITKPQTLENIKNIWMEEVKKVDENIEVMLVGNKSDL